MFKYLCIVLLLVACTDNQKSFTTTSDFNNSESVSVGGTNINVNNIGGIGPGVEPNQTPIAGPTNPEAPTNGASGSGFENIDYSAIHFDATKQNILGQCTSKYLDDSHIIPWQVEVRKTVVVSTTLEFLKAYKEEYDIVLAGDIDLADVKELPDPNFDFVRLIGNGHTCLLYTSPSPRDRTRSRMPSSA